MALAVLVGALVGGAILVAGRAASIEAWLLAGVGAATFGDLVRRGVAERGQGRGDPTDVWMSAAFAVVLIGTGWDVGRQALSPISTEVAVGLRVAGCLLIAAGVWLRSRAAAAMGTNFLVRLGVREGHTIVETGPYRRIRHPTYSALLLVALGTAAAFASPTALLLTLCVWLPIVLVRIRREEKILLERFGDVYRQYCARTGRLLPGL